MKLIIESIIVAITMCAIPARADSPRFGTVQSESPRAMIQYECLYPEGDGRKIVCEFIRVEIKKSAERASPEQIRELAESRLAEERSRVSGAECNFFVELSRALRGDISLDGVVSSAPDGFFSDKAEALSGIGQLPQSERATLARSMEVLGEFCADPTLENLENALRIKNERETATCKLYVSRFEREFQLNVSGGSDETWIALSSPEGSCSVIDVSRFERPRGVGSDFTWNFVLKRISANPSGSRILGGTCADYDMEEQYEWQLTTHRDECTYIDFYRF